MTAEKKTSVQLAVLITDSASNFGRFAPVILEFAVEGGLADAQLARGFDLIISGFFQGSEDGTPHDFFQPRGFIVSWKGVRRSALGREVFHLQNGVGT